MNIASILTITIGPISIALLCITIMSLVKEPNRQIINALAIAGAGGVYWSSGLGVYEFPLGIIMAYLAFKGLKNYKFLAAGWIVHTVYDILHHLYGQPIIPMAPDSSLGCAICDPVLAIWLYFGAPSIFDILKIRRAA